MSLLSHKELCHLIRDKVIENCDVKLVNGASIDITLGAKILVEDRFKYKVVDFRKREPLRMIEAEITEYVLSPGAFILAQSEQVFNLPPDLAAEYKLKSSMARIGLNHLNAGWCDPTWHGSVLTLELVNVTRNHGIILRPGDPIGQVVFFRCAPVRGSVAYKNRGRYNNDKAVRGIKP